MRTFAEIADRIAGTTKKLEKVAILSEYFRSVPVEHASVAAVFFSGRPFPAWEETTLQVGGSMLWRAVAEVSGKPEHLLTNAYRKLGDLGAVAEAVLSEPHPPETGRAPLSRVDQSPVDIQIIFREIATARRPAFKAVVVRRLLDSISPREAKYVVKIMTGDLRIGLKESLVEEAIARTYTDYSSTTLKAVQRANMLLGDIGETLKLAAAGRLSEAKMRLFHPIGFMLASPSEDATDALSYFHKAWVEDKYDGIRAQAHCSGDDVRFFSRTRDEITESFPELPDALGGLPGDAILDGEILAWSYNEDSNTPGVQGRALPFSALQKRLGRKVVSPELLRDVSVAYLVFDVLYAGGELVIDRPLDQRSKILEELLSKRKPNHNAVIRRRTRAESQGILELDFSSLSDGDSPARHETRAGSIVPTGDEHRPTAIIRAPVFSACSADELNALFDAAQARGNEGLMIKDPESPYTPGRRGKSWLKLKRALATLDVVVTAVEFGHGKRIGVLSDYTFAVRDGEQLLNVGKAYSGLTDAEIAEMTKWFLDHTIEDQGFRRVVEPKIVLEVAFNNVMKSDRHASGYALRFPRIVRLRTDKLPEEADTLERVRSIYEAQSSSAIATPREPL